MVRRVGQRANESETAYMANLLRKQNLTNLSDAILVDCGWKPIENL